MGLLAGDCLFIYTLTVEVHLQAKLPAVSDSMAKKKCCVIFVMEFY